MSNLAWALAEIGYYEPQLWDAMAQYLLEPPGVRAAVDASRWREHEAESREQASAASKQLRDARGQPLLERMQAFELSKLVWAYAKVRA